MSLKAELETWAAALKAYDEEDFEKSLGLFSVRSAIYLLLAFLTVHKQQIADSSKILTNIGLIYATLGEHEAAVERFTEATQLDQYLAVACVFNTPLLFLLPHGFTCFWSIHPVTSNVGSLISSSVDTSPP